MFARLLVVLFIIRCANGINVSVGLFIIGNVISNLIPIITPCHLAIITYIIITITIGSMDISMVALSCAFWVRLTPHPLLGSFSHLGLLICFGQIW
jgi:hypothetical protein